MWLTFECIFNFLGIRGLIKMFVFGVLVEGFIWFTFNFESRREMGNLGFKVVR